MLFFTGRFSPSSHSLFGTNSVFGHDCLASDSRRFHTISQFNRQLITPVFPRLQYTCCIQHRACVTNNIFDWTPHRACVHTGRVRQTWRGCRRTDGLSIRRGPTGCHTPRDDWWHDGRTGLIENSIYFTNAYVRRDEWPWPGRLLFAGRQHLPTYK